MAALYKTQCPHCAAQFRLSDQHLKQAKGAVRCGSCMLVFQADQHLVEIPEGAVKPPVRAAQPSEQPSWHDMDLSQSLDAKATTPSASSNSEFSDSFLALSNDDFSQPLQNEDFSDMEGAAASEPSANNDDAWAEALLRELEEDDKTPPTTESTTPPAHAPDNEEPVTEEDNDGTGLDDWLNEGLFDELLLPEQTSKATPAPANIFSRPGINWWQQIKWTAASFVLLAALAAQFLYFNFEKIARTPEYRPTMAQLCDLIGCQLPSMSNLNRIRSQHLVVRTHPEYDDALQVDALLYNLASHDQPYPNLALEFSNKKDEVVASRLFKPAEYLPGNLKDADTMPPSTPVRISLTLTNPSNDAINHRMLFYSPDNPSSP